MSKNLWDNTNFQLLGQLVDDIHRIADAIAPSKTVEEDGVYAMLAGAVGGCASGLEDVLNSGANMAVKSEQLRNLVVRWRGLSNEYMDKQAKIDQERALK